MTAKAAVRVPGRARFGGLFTGETTSFLAWFGAAWLGSAFYQLDGWRSVLLGAGGTTPRLLLALLTVLALLTWAPLLRRSFLWAEPAALTWLDFTGRDRARSISVRVWTVWLLRLLALTYTGALLAAVARAPMWTVLVGAAVLGTTAVVVLALAAGVGHALRLPVALAAGRPRLVAGWHERIVRVVAVTFLDPLLMLPAARPVPGHRLGSLPRFVLAGMVGRSRYAVPALLLAVLVAFAHAALPGLPDVVLVALGAYAAVMPFAGGLGWLWRSPGLRRWLDGPDVALRGWHAAGLAAVATGWALVVLVVTVLLGAPLSAAAWLSLPVMVGAVVRTATRPPISYEAPGQTDTPFGPAPVRLVAQLVRGPDLGVVGVWLLAAVPLGLVTVLVTAVLVVWCVLR
ncbi:DUF6297 family protein [Saccharomonospora sp. NPDC046836]|uniref:DUF6297 family protein n=1 Tax=Saccharomonospora sp. NPDC046836 TaxID=3156921 RepID=UPI003400E1B8